MPGMSFLVASVVALQQPVVVVPPVPPVPPVASVLEAVRAARAVASVVLPDVTSLHGLESLIQDEQDPTDSLWRAARQALNREDYQVAATLYGDVVRRYPKTARAGDALYWAAFSLYKNDNLDRARSLLVTQERQYPKAATLRDAAALLARIQTALAKQGDEEAARWLSGHAQPDTTRAGGCPTEDDEEDMRVAALNGLLQMDANNAVPILKKVLARRDACSAGLRRKAVFIISQKRGSETENLLLDVAQHDPDSEVRQQAVFWLSQVPTDRAVAMLDSILRSTDDAELREKALFALSQQHGPRAGQILRDYAQNANAPSDAREKAIFWLGQQHSSENAVFLRGLYAKLADEELKEKVIFSLSQMHDADNNRWLMDIALNEREPIEMRKKALFWAGQTGGDLAQLSGLYDRMQNREMKEQLIFVYSQRHEPAAVDRLIQIAKTEQDKELRKRAIFWLGQSHDPRAAQVLLEIINQ
ncbi:MAG TPA: HEAT repeat domain-containing protein [Gemmatimonadales bacterium]|nr:HEAT repeat domain-containing protein [Gemmatimonadales bacterium]